MSTIKVDTVRPVTADASLTLQGDSGGSGVTGLTIDSSGVFNTTTAKVTNIQATSGQSLTIKDEDGNAAITVGTDNTAAGYLSLNFGSYHGDSAGAGSGTLTGNTLDDYEEGTWTPGLGGTWTVNPTSLSGQYIKIGKIVWLRAQWLGGSKSSAVAAHFTNIPLAVSDQATGSVSNVSVNDYGNALVDGGQRIFFTANSFSATCFANFVYETH